MCSASAATRRASSTTPFRPVSASIGRRQTSLPAAPPPPRRTLGDAPDALRQVGSNFFLLLFMAAVDTDLNSSL